MEFTGSVMDKQYRHVFLTTVSDWWGLKAIHLQPLTESKSLVQSNIKTPNHQLMKFFSPWVSYYPLSFGKSPQDPHSKDLLLLEENSWTLQGRVPFKMIQLCSLPLVQLDHGDTQASLPQPRLMQLACLH